MMDWIEGRMYGLDPLSKEIIDKAPFGMEWIIQPKMEMLTHRLHFSCTNKWGGESKYFLDSLKVEQEVWERFRGKTIADIYLTEADNFKESRTFDCLVECLRDYPPEQRRLICDTNPPEEADEHWLHKKFFQFPSMDLDNLSNDHKKELGIDLLVGKEYDDAWLSLKELQAELVVHTFSVADNAFISDKEKRAQFARYALDHDLRDRMFYGIWKRATGDGIFSETFREEIHVRGEYQTPANPDPEKVIPEEGCFEMLGSWDIGNRRNSAVYLIEPIRVEVIENDEPVPKIGFKYLWGFSSVGVQQDLARTHDAVMEGIEWIEGYIGKEPRWIHWSDSSSFDVSGQTQTSEATDIWRMSNGKIELRSITTPYVGMKGQGSVERRINMMQRMLFENRIFISAAKCPALVQMFKSIKRNNAGKLATTNPLKHDFDAASYGPSVECFMEMKRTMPKIRMTSDAKILVTEL